MKKWTCILLAILILCGCSTKSESEQPDPATLPPQTEPTAEVVETQPPETEAPWSPYAGTSKGYVFYHTLERDQNWEEDIIYLGDSYLNNFHTLTRFASRFELIDGVEYSDEFYDPEFRQEFIDQINLLIPQIPDLSDTQILYELQRIVATLNDAHTSVSIPFEDYIPIGFEVFYEDGEPVYRATYLPTKYEYAMFTSLTGINGIPLDEVIARLKPYISHENEYLLSALLSGSGYPGYLSCTDLLVITGIMEDPEDTVRYDLVYPGGVPFKLKMESCTVEESAKTDCVGWTHDMAYPDIYQDPEKDFYHYRLLAEDDMMYVRFNEFTPMEDYPVLNLGNDILREIRDAGGVEKLVVDLRRNPGGSKSLGFPEFITVLKRLDVAQIYVLIDQGTFSCAMVMATQIKHHIPDAILVGTPAGQPPNFYAGMYDGDYTMPNCGIICRVPTAYYRMMPDYEFDALMPDITVYPTLEDYYSGIDTILEAVKKH